MSALAAFVLFAAALGVLVLPRRHAALPLLAAGCYLPVALTLDLGPFHFYALRVLVTAGIVRVVLRRETLPGGMRGIDWTMLAWALVALASSFFRVDVSGTLVNRLGLVYTACGSYFVLRRLCASSADLVQLCRATVLVLLPLAAAMVWDRATGHNLFAELAGGAVSAVRGGEVRAQGPFAHPILAGTVGATMLPLMVLLWRPKRWTAIAGIAACIAIVLSSGSSGPMLSMVLGIVALLMWPLRDHMRMLRWSALLCYLLLDAVMKAPAYYLIARVDLTGNSTSWHRAALIEAAIAHFSEWWFAGTAYTRHWLAYGVTWSADNIDITNHYLRMGVDGGLALMLLFIVVLWKGFAAVGHAWRAADPADAVPPFSAWALGASLFAHAASFISVSYFDQSVLYFYLVLAMIGSAAGLLPRAVRESVDAGVPASPRSSSAASAAPWARPQRGTR